VWECEQAERQGISERAFAESRGVPRSTLRAWRARKRSLDAEAELIAFFESPVGLAFLHRLVLAAHFVLGQLGPCGVDLVCEFFRRAGLWPFVASSHGTHHAIALDMEAQIVAFGEAQEDLLAAGMRPREIVLCQDETFHRHRPCLVSMHSPSGFLVLERYAVDRTAETWTSVLNAATAKLKVTIVSIASDEAAGLIHHAKKMLGIEQSPDLFHMQRDLWRALAWPLTERLGYPREMLERAQRNLDRWLERKARHEAGQRSPGRPPDFDRHIAVKAAELDAARAAFDEANEQRDVTYQAIRQCSSAYHPVDPETGDLRSVEQVRADLEAAFETIDAAVETLRLSRKRRDLVNKARRGQDGGCHRVLLRPRRALTGGAGARGERQRLDPGGAGPELLPGRAGRARHQGGRARCAAGDQPAFA
jgi:hypothetical protein